MGLTETKAMWRNSKQLRELTHELAVAARLVRGLFDEFPEIHMRKNM